MALSAARSPLTPRRSKAARSLSFARLAAAMLGLLLLLAARPALAGDWPTYKHDLCRTSFIEERLSFPMRLAWRYVSPQPPSPAWPDTFWLLNRTDFDYAPHPVIASGIVCFGSTSDDTVRALDIATGQEKWHYIAGGPVRIAPQIEAGKVYFGADDGFVTCLDAATGKVVWRFMAAPRDERLVGNHRMISRWPVRTGVVVAEGVVYAAAGMLNMEGVFIYALKADTGEIIWCNDTAGFLSVTIVDFPESADPRHETVGGHNGEFAGNAAVGANPQGPMLLSGNLLLIPNANSSTITLDRRTGFPTPSGGGGGTWLTIDKEIVYSYTQHHEDVLQVVPSPLGTATGKLRNWGKGHVPQVRIMNPKVGQIHDKRKVSSIVHDGKLYSQHAYGLGLAGNTLLVGTNGGIIAQDGDTDREFWRGEVDGEAREIAIANGRVYVGTSTGAIYCFVPASKGDQTPALVVDPAAKTRTAPAPAVPPTLAQVLDPLRRSGMDRGFALVMGDPDGTFSRALAAQTMLRIVNVSNDEAAAAALREKLLAETCLNGQHIQACALPRLDQLPFPQFFANTVIIAGPPGVKAAYSAKELYRVLKPCGGLLLAPGISPTDAAAFFKTAGATEAEIKSTADLPYIARGKLPGALDWDSAAREGNRIDQRVKWPLRPLWFGGPATAQIHGFGAGSDVTIANGRYFVEGEQTLTAVDAYNGELLWSRPIPRQSPAATAIDGVIYRVSEPDTGDLNRETLARSVRADDNFVYVSMGSAFFRTIGDALSKELGETVNLKGKGGGLIKLDARTGEQVAIAAPFNPPPSFTLKTPQTWSIDVDPRRSGKLTLESNDRGLLLTLATKDPLVTKLDSWDLFFDFRPPAARAGLYERGTFSVHVIVAQDKKSSATWLPGTGVAHPALEVAGTRDADGTKSTVLLTWAEVEKLTGERPASFGFAAAMNLHDGGQDEPILCKRIFADWTADGLNNGWATMTLNPSAAPAPGSRPAIYVDAMKGGGAAHDPGDIIVAARAEPRVHPLTGELVPKMYRRGACGGRSNSSVIRSGSQSIYDFEDDSGMRPLGGVKARCSTPQEIALGLLIYSEENGHCECPFPLRTTMVFAPAERRLNEDWAFYFDQPADTRLRQASINLGAPGDRRDDRGTLWLGYPRIPAEKSRAFPLPAGEKSSVGADGVWLRVMSAVMQVPLDIECFGGPNAYKPQEDLAAPYGWQSNWMPGRRHRELGPIRVNADRAVIRNDDRPWIYASEYRGIKKATFKLNLMPRLAAAPIDKPPPMDGQRAHAPWTGDPQALLPFTQTRVFLRRDAENLYIAARRPSGVDRLGFVARWTMSAKGEDSRVWEDDSFEVFLSDAAGGPVMHLGVSASGGRFDALRKGSEKEDVAWNGAWRSAVMADQSPKAIAPGSGSKDPVPKDQAFVMIKEKKPSKADELDPAVPSLEAPTRTDPTGVAVDEQPLVIEIAIPWKTIEAAGIHRDSLALNFQTNQRDTSGMPATSPGTMQVGKFTSSSAEALSYLGIGGRAQCVNFAPLSLEAGQAPPTRKYTVRLHFAELDDVKPGQRVFDVKVQEQVLLKNFDVVKEAGGPRTALVKEFKGIAAGDTLNLEFIPAATEVNAGNAPILSGIEFFEEGFTPPSVKQASAQGKDP